MTRDTERMNRLDTVPECIQNEIIHDAKNIPFNKDKNSE
jgi:hypothetical protein